VLLVLARACFSTYSAPFFDTRKTGGGKSSQRRLTTLPKSIWASGRAWRVSVIGGATTPAMLNRDILILLVFSDEHLIIPTLTAMVTAHRTNRQM
jgi:hypothetical protein